MKAWQLAELLLKHPDAEVVINEYTGGLTESIAVDEAKLVRQGKFCNGDGGKHLDKAGFAKVDIIVLS